MSEHAKSDMASWESDFHQMMESQRDGMEYEASMEDYYKNLAEEDIAFDQQQPIDFDQDGLPDLGGYIFGDYYLMVS